MNVQLAVRFPDEWSFIPVDGGDAAIDEVLAPLAAGGAGAPEIADARQFFDAVIARMRDGNILAFAAFAHADDDPPSFVQATCLVALDALDPGAEHPYAALAAASPFEGMDVETTAFPAAGGVGARAVTFRRETHLADETGAWPYVLEARYALPAIGQAALLLHFESFTALYTDGLLSLFDAIAETAVVTT